MKNGGSAFPIPSGQGHDCYNKAEFGMSLRDYFAGRAMEHYNFEAAQDLSVQELASDCYRLADAMIKEREKNGN